MNTQKPSTVLARFVTTLILVILQIFITAVPVQAAPTVTRTLDQNNPGTWTLTGSMATARFLHTATLLEDGKVLVAGGYNDSGGLTSAELYNSMTGTWSAVPGMMATPRQAATATRLLDGRVLITGGADDLGVPLSSAELYDPITGLWAPTGAMTTTRQTHTATLLQNGKVLVVGGSDIDGNILASAEVYDPLTGSWATTTTPMAVVRQRHTATLLSNGKVLVSGGFGVSFIDIHTSAELYDPATGSWTPTGSMSEPRANYSATRLPNGQVLISGGSGFGLVASAELYNPTTGSWASAGSLSVARYGHTATLLPNDKVLIVGGITEGGIPPGVVELYDTTNGLWTTTGSLVTSRFLNTATLLSDGNVLVTGGVGDGATLASAEIYQAVAPKANQTITILREAPDSATAGTSFTVEAEATSRLPVSYSSSGDCTNIGSVFTMLPGLVNCLVMYNQVGDTNFNAAPTVTETVTHRPGSTSTGSLGTNRSNHTATLLPDGKVLVVGGLNNTTTLASSELYNPATGTWTITADTLAFARRDHTATLLPNGKVLVAGGRSASSALNSAELYDPVTGNWSLTDPMAVPRYRHTATLLPNGKVLVIGGNGLNTAELYDPVAGTWSIIPNVMSTARTYHTATLLNNGKVLVAGGIDSDSNVLSSAELFDPTTGSWTNTGSLAIAREFHTATLLPNDKVLVTGGDNENDLPTSTELYDPTSGLWTTTGSLTIARHSHTATLLPNGKVLVAGGRRGVTLLSVELYDPASGIWNIIDPIITDRAVHTATLLANGQILLVGGLSNTTTLASAELYGVAPTRTDQTIEITIGAPDNAVVGESFTVAATASSSLPVFYSSSGQCTNNGPVFTILPGFNNCLVIYNQMGDPSYNAAPTLTQTVNVVDPAGWTLTGSLSTDRFAHTATLLPNGTVLVVGGSSIFNQRLASSELYNPATGTWTATPSMLATARGYHTATLLPNGKVLVVGGSSNINQFLASAELYDPATGLWTPTGAMSTARQEHTATLLPNGKVLVAGGSNDSGIPTTAELYDPTTGLWTPTGAMVAARYNHTATLLPNGKVLVAGGFGLVGCLATAELYDPATGLWTPTGAMSTDRCRQPATVLPNGKVLVAGGSNDSGILNTAELYDPATGLWTPTGAMVTARHNHKATLLPNGKVLVAGGGNSSNFSLSSVELYDVATGLWTPTGAMTTGRHFHTLTLLPNGTVLATGGITSGILGNAELYGLAPTRSNQTISITTSAPTSAPVMTTFTVSASASSGLPISYSSSGGCTNVGPVFTTFPASSNCLVIYNQMGDPSYNPALTITQTVLDPAAWGLTGSMSSYRFGTTATLLSNGKVLVAGGSNDSGILNTAELYDPATGLWTPTGAMSTARQEHTAILLPNGKVLIAGGIGNNSIGLASAELYDPATGLWAPTGAMSTGRHFHTLTLLNNGKVLIVGGSSLAELYDPATGLWTPTGENSTTRFRHTATLLLNGKVLVAGGSGISELATAELYDPATGLWAPTGSMFNTRERHSATLLPDGTVLAAGGFDGDSLASAEIYNPATELWAPIGAMTNARANHTATLLPNGLVLLAGGLSNNQQLLASAELYNPATKLWAPTATMNSARSNHTVTLLPNGTVLAVGGSVIGSIPASAELYETGPAINIAPVITEGITINVSMSENGSPTAFVLILHATDLNGDTITWSISTPASHGSATASGIGFSKVIGYTPMEGYSGTDSFDVQISDGKGGTDTITVNVTIRPVLIVTPNSQTIPYGDVEQPFTASYAGFLEGDDPAGINTPPDCVADGTHPRGVGSYTISCFGASDDKYDFKYMNNTLTITARPITVTADPKSKDYGTPDPALTYQITSGLLVTGDSLTGALTRVAGENVGTYAITQGTLSAGNNYDLTYVGNNLTITALPITVTADPQIKAYGTPDPVLTYQVTSGALVSDDSFTGALSRVAGESVGTYLITQGTLTAGSNYDLTYVPNNLTITPPADLLFANGFESGNLSAWSANATDAGDLSATSAAKLVESFGMQAVIDDNTSIYVTDNTPNAELRYRARFYFDPNSILMNNGNAHFIFYGYSGASPVVSVEFQRSAGLYQLRAAIRSDGNKWTNTSWFTISDAPHAIELDWRSATAPKAKDGGLTFWIDGIQQVNLSNIDNDTVRIDSIQLGAVSGIDTKTRGTYYFDAFESRRQTYIGP